MEDTEAYLKYPKQRKWMNKLWLAEKFGYVCGPAGVEIPETGTYVVRPIYNLAGMGACASVQKLAKGDHTSIAPGYFWCEYFDGKHYSANYEWKMNDHVGGKWVGLSCWEGINMPINLSRFVEWRRSNHIPTLPHSFKALGENVTHLNVEFINDKPIEVHLRLSPNPVYDLLIPVWASDIGKKKEHMELHGFEFIEDYEDANGYIDDPRIGFLVK
jgi:hypothetical protein